MNSKQIIKLILLFIGAFVSVFASANDTKWQYDAYLYNAPGATANPLSVGSFNSIAEAEEALRAAHPYAATLQLDTTNYAENGSTINIARVYRLLPTNMIVGPYRYGECQDFLKNTTVSSEIEAINKVESALIANKQLCSITSTSVVYDWKPGASSCSILWGAPHWPDEKDMRFTGPYPPSCNLVWSPDKIIYRKYDVTCPPETPILNETAGKCSSAMYGTISQLNNSARSPAAQCLQDGNPCLPGSGLKLESQPDYTGPFLPFIRSYISDYKLSRKHGIWEKETTGYGLGDMWSHNYNIRILNYLNVLPTSTTVSPVVYLREDGFIEIFGGSNGQYTSSFSSGRIFTRLADNSWRFDTPESTTYFFADGKPNVRTERSGNSIHFTYDTADITHSKLLGVYDDLGHQLIFEYDGNGYLSFVTTPIGKFTYQYEPYTEHWLSKSRLSTVLKPDGTTRNYQYSTNVNFPALLTGIVDENNILFGNYQYDLLGRITDSVHPGSVIKTNLAYNIDDTVTVTNSRNQVKTYAIGATTTVRYSTAPYNPTTIAYYVPNSTFIYWKNDGYGTTNTYYYGANSMLARQVEADGSAVYRNTYYEYTDVRFPFLTTKITSPSVYTGVNTAQKTTTYTYDDGGRPTQITVSGFDTFGNPVSRATTFQYNGPLNQLSQIDGPRTDVSDITTFDYYPIVAGDVNSGRLQRVTLANGTIARDNIQYSPTGKVLSETRPNGLTFTYTYYPGNDRLNTLTQSDGTTSRVSSWSYYPTGLVQTITSAANTSTPITMTFTYDDAHRLTRLTDALGNYREYTLDTEGNNTAENVYDATGVLQRSLSQTFDLYNRLQTVSQANEARTTNFAPDGTLSNTIDGKNVKSQYTYDALKRLLTSTQDVGGTDVTTQNALTQYGYDVQDNLTSVTDPVNGKTSYVYDDVGNLVSQTSPDTGTTKLTYDNAGNVQTRTDAKGQVFSYSYDALNRLLSVSAPDPTQSITYTYDNCVNGIGRLCSLAQGLYNTTYAYNAFGQVTTSQYLNYAYDDHGRLGAINYPSGNAVIYSYDSLGHINNVSALVNGMMMPILSNATYAPFGPLNNLTYGNGVPLTRTFDTAYRLLDNTAGNAFLQTGSVYDANGNLIQRNESLIVTLYNYDTMERLNNASGSFGVTTYTLDKNGNRTQDTANASATSYAYAPPNSNRLATLNGGLVAIDPNGNTTILRNLTFTYDNFNRMSTVSNAVYGYNALHQRVTKTVNGITTTYLYGLNGELLAELDANGTTQVEYYYANGVPVAVSQQGNVYYIHPDHLGTPRVMTDANQTVIWRWDSDPFGVGAANEDPDGDGVKVTMNLRFPGQYFDAESGLHYNYHRYYDPQTGRYVTSDPIGLDGGLNTYAYVDGNPLSFIDPFGLRDLTREELIEISNGMTEPWMEVIDVGAGGTAAAAKVIIKDAAKKCIKKGAANPKIMKALKKGQKAHKDREYGPGYKKEVQLPSGKRMDAYNEEAKDIRELKPNNPRAIKKGEKQVEEYCRECDEVYGPGHTGSVETYD